MNSYRVVYASAQKLLTEKRQTQLAIIITQKVTRATPHHLYFSICSKCPPAAQMQAVDVDITCQQHIQ